jgi:transcription elongation factor GreB
MQKGFTRRPRPDAPGMAGPNFITPGGLQRLKDESRFLLTRERPAVTEVVTWATSHGDRSENADYQYGKRRLRFLMKRIEAAKVVDPAAPRRGEAAERVYFGATVRYADEAGAEHVVCIVGADEVDLARRHVSWTSPLGRALMKAAEGGRRRWKLSRFVTRRLRWSRSGSRRGRRRRGVGVGGRSITDWFSGDGGRSVGARCSGRVHGCHRRRSTLRWVENFDFVWRLGSPEFGSMGNL